MARRSRSDLPTATFTDEDAADESGALRRGLEIMRMISSAEAAVGVDAVVREFKTTRATARRLIATLVEQRFLRASRDPDRFFADVASLTVGQAFLASMDGLEPLAATLRTFQGSENVAVTAWVRERTEGICLATSGSSAPLVGHRFDLDRFAAGHALMWSAEGPTRIALLERFARTTGARLIGKPGAVYTSFARLETHGYCISDAVPDGVERAAAFAFRPSPAGRAVAFSLESMPGGPSLDASRTKGLVTRLADLASRTLAA